ncbi:MAG: hypothetical protein IJC36_01945 [Clostridia bacterium]|nr:hypothetical protein [Clostridia bacterium]
MKLTCNICGAPLQMNPNNNGAFCTNCGMNYSVESLRNKLNAGANVPPTNSILLKKKPTSNEVGFLLF